MSRLFDKLIKRILKKEKVRGIISLVLVDDKKIRRLNKQFRKKDKATDVLAFPFGEEGILGDIAISVAMARRNAKKFGVTYQQELKRLVVHGVLHLLGYNHGKEMNHAAQVYEKFAIR